MLYRNYTEELIGLKDICVKFIERNDDLLKIHISMSKRIHKCPRCGESTSKVHDYRTQAIKDITEFGEKIIIYLRKRSRKCKYFSNNSSKNL